MLHSDSGWLLDGLKLLFSGRHCAESYMAFEGVYGVLCTVYMAL